MLPWILLACCTVFLIIWMALTFTNQFCTGNIGFGLCYQTADDPACPVCETIPAPAAAPVGAPRPAPAPTTAGAPTPSTTSGYMPEPYSK